MSRTSNIASFVASTMKRDMNPSGEKMGPSDQPQESSPIDMLAAIIRENQKRYEDLEGRYEAQVLTTAKDKQEIVRLSTQLIQTTKELMEYKHENAALKSALHQIKSALHAGKEVENEKTKNDYVTQELESTQTGLMKERWLLKP